MMKNIVKIVAVMAIACVVALKAYDKQNVNVSDVVLANVEAMASNFEVDLPGVGITCSRYCNDGIGRCWDVNEKGHCKFEGYQYLHCTNLPCEKSDGSTY